MASFKADAKTMNALINAMGCWSSRRYGGCRRTSKRPSQTIWRAWRPTRKGTATKRWRRCSSTCTAPLRSRPDHLAHHKLACPLPCGERLLDRGGAESSCCIAGLLWRRRGADTSSSGRPAGCQGQSASGTRCQAMSGRSCSQRARPWVPRSMAGQRSGGMPRLRQPVTDGGATPPCGRRRRCRQSCRGRSSCEHFNAHESVCEAVAQLGMPTVRPWKRGKSAAGTSNCWSVASS